MQVEKWPERKLGDDVCFRETQPLLETGRMLSRSGHRAVTVKWDQETGRTRLWS